MAKPAVQFSPSALEDMLHIAEYYAQQGVPDIGQQTIVTLRDAVKALVTHPRMGRIVPEFNVDNLRELIRPPFRVVYSLEPDQTISVIRIWRSERLLTL